MDNEYKWKYKTLKYQVKLLQAGKGGSTPLKEFTDELERNKKQKTLLMVQEERLSGYDYEGDITVTPDEKGALSITSYVVKGKVPEYVNGELFGADASDVYLLLANYVFKEKPTLTLKWRQNRHSPAQHREVVYEVRSDINQNKDLLDGIFPTKARSLMLQKAYECVVRLEDYDLKAHGGLLHTKVNNLKSVIQRAMKKHYPEVQI
jgi:hypothetical protein